MSNYRGYGIHPETNEVLPCDWLDNHFGTHRYGARFGDGIIRQDVQEVSVNSVLAICAKCNQPLDDACDNAGHPVRYEVKEKSNARNSGRA